MNKEQVARWELTMARPDGDCLITTAPQARGGYGQVSILKRKHLVHRLVLADKLGRTLRSGEMACHTCHRRACINPDHLYAGSHADNMRDRTVSKRYADRRGAASPSAKLTPSQVVEIRRRYAAGGVLQRELAAEYGVDTSTIGQVVRRVIWTELP